MTLRLSKIFLLAGIAVWVSLVAATNITDYGTNLAFVHHVLAMDTIFPQSGIRYRAIRSTSLQFMAYDLIIAVESLVAVLCWFGVWRLWRVRREAAAFRRSKRPAVVALTLGILLWFVGFIVIGGEWFGMWMSSQWNGIASAFRFTLILLASLIFLVQNEGEPDA